jgi:predicted PurR-regulated permease PerM
MGLLLILGIATFALVIWLLIEQLNYLNTDIPAVTDKIELLLNQAEEWFNNKTGSLLDLEEDCWIKLVLLCGMPREPTCTLQLKISPV